MYEAIVVGGGIVGASAAYHLAEGGVETLLVDRNDEGRATDAGAGILSPATSSHTASDPWFAFAVEAVDYYPALVAALEAEISGDAGYARCGLLSVAFEGEEEAFERASRRLAERRERFGVPAADAVRELSAADARRRFPPLGEPARARYYEDAARVDGRRFADALIAAGEANGLRVERANAERIRVADGSVEGIVADGTRFDAQAVVVAGGAWSSAFGDQLGVEIPVAPQRGQIAHLGVRGGNAGDWPIVSGFRDHYLVPWPDGRVAAGATREDGTGFAPHTTAGGVRGVLDEALAVAPGLADARLRELRVGLRPVSTDRLPILGRVPGVEGAHLATGHGATGLQLGPFSGRVVADLVRGAEPSVDRSAFRVDRFE